MSGISLSYSVLVSFHGRWVMKAARELAGLNHLFLLLIMLQHLLIPYLFPLPIAHKKALWIHSCLVVTDFDHSVME